MSLRNRIRPLEQRLVEPWKPVPGKVPVVKAQPEAPKPSGKKRGPKPSPGAKVLLTLRLDPDIIEAFRATGPGWQARINEALRRQMP